MRRTARAWLAARAAAVPPRLQVRMEEAVCAVTPVPGMSVAQVLGEAALGCLRESVPHCDERGAALHLLAADALITYACEAASDDASRLDELCASFAPAQLGARIAPPVEDPLHTSPGTGRGARLGAESGAGP